VARMARTGRRRPRGLARILAFALLAAAGTGLAVQVALGGSTHDGTPSTADPTVDDVSGEARAFTTPPAPAVDLDWKLSKPVEDAVPTGEAVGSAGSGGKEVALTFDDGPSGYTGQVLDILDRHGAKATFFIVGRNAEHNTALIRRAVESGHEIGNHTWSHASLTGLAKAARHQEVQGTNDLVRATVGHAPQLFRPPYGAMRPGTNREVRRAGLLPVVWSVDTRDYEPGVTAKLLIARTRAALRPGSIILLHDGGGNRRKTVAALPKILDEIARQGYRAVTVTQLLNDAPPEADDLAGRM
jgi:peptidoglycan/xylan/chitin deacetylase (PgdA/CDA1 family)